MEMGEHTLTAAEASPGGFKLEARFEAVTGAVVGRGGNGG